MSFFSRVWTGEFKGHEVKVQQQKGSHQYVLLIDGEQVDEYTSPINMGKRFLKATLNHDGKEHVVEVVANQNAFTESVKLTVDGEEISMQKS